MGLGSPALHFDCSVVNLKMLALEKVRKLCVLLFPEWSGQHRVTLLTAPLLFPAHFVDGSRAVLVNSRHHWVVKFPVSILREPDFQFQVFFIMLKKLGLSTVELREIIRKQLECKSF